MIFLDIDNTIGFTFPSPEQKAYWEAHGGFTTARALFHDISIANYVIEALRGTQDVYLLSTWGEFAQNLVDAFDLRCGVINYRDHTDLNGIGGKFFMVQHYASQVRLWADDHILPEQREWCNRNGVEVIIPEPTFGLTFEDVQSIRAQR